MPKLNQMPSLISMIITKAKSFGLTPLLIPGKNLLMTFSCPRCKGKKMVKFTKQPDLRNKIWACPCCGFRRMSKGWITRHGTFITHTTV